MWTVLAEILHCNKADDKLANLRKFATRVSQHSYLHILTIWSYCHTFPEFARNKTRW